MAGVCVRHIGSWEQSCLMVNSFYAEKLTEATGLAQGIINLA